MNQPKHIILEAVDHLELAEKINQARENGYMPGCCPLIHPHTGYFYQAMYLVSDVYN